MTPEQNEEYEERRDRIRNDLEDAHWALENSRKSGEPLVGDFRSLFRDWYRMANLSLLLDDIQRARREFATSALYIRALRDELVTRWNDLSKSRRQNAGIYLEWGFYMAVLSGDSRLIDAVTSDLLTLTEDFKADYGGVHGSSGAYWQACALACLYNGSEATARNYLDHYSREDDARQTALVKMVHEALLAKDEQEVREALQQMADEHADIFGESRPWKAQLSHATAVHLLVARYRGIDISASALDSEYVPGGVDQYDIGDNIELPTPKYVDEELLV